MAAQRNFGDPVPTGGQEDNNNIPGCSVVQGVLQRQQEIDESMKLIPTDEGWNAVPSSSVATAQAGIIQPSVSRAAQSSRLVLENQEDGRRSNEAATSSEGGESSGEEESTGEEESIEEGESIGEVEPIGVSPLPLSTNSSSASSQQKTAHQLQLPASTTFKRKMATRVTNLATSTSVRVKRPKLAASRQPKIMLRAAKASYGRNISSAHCVEEDLSDGATDEDDNQISSDDNSQERVTVSAFSIHRIPIDKIMKGKFKDTKLPELKIIEEIMKEVNLKLKNQPRFEKRSQEYRTAGNQQMQTSTSEISPQQSTTNKSRDETECPQQGKTGITSPLQLISPSSTGVAVPSQIETLHVTRVASNPQMNTLPLTIRQLETSSPTASTAVHTQQMETEKLTSFVPVQPEHNSSSITITPQTVPPASVPSTSQSQQIGNSTPTTLLPNQYGFQIVGYVQEVNFKKLETISDQVGIPLGSQKNINIILFYYRQNEIFTVTFGQTWRKLQPYHCYEFPHIISSRLTNASCIQESSKLFTGIVSTMKTTKKTAASTDTLNKVSINVLKELRTDASINRLKEFSRRVRGGGLRRGRKGNPKIRFGIACIRIEKKMDMRNLPQRTMANKGDFWAPSFYCIN